MYSEGIRIDYISRNLKFLRRMMSKTQEEFAKLMHMSRSSYASLESGDRQITLGELYRIRQITDVEADTLIHTDLRRDVILGLKSAAGISDTEAFIDEFSKLSINGRKRIAAQIKKLRAEETELRKAYEDNNDID